MTNWYIGAKVSSTNLVLATGIERQIVSFKCTKRFNAMGVWELVLQDTVNSPSALASIFLRDSSGNLHNGIFLELDNADGNGLQYVFSGPETDCKVDVDPAGVRTITATGKSEEYWLAKRRAFQVPHYPYVLALSTHGFVSEGTLSGGLGTLEPNWYNFGNPANLVAYLPLWDTSGTSAQNLGAGSPAAGTYNGGFTLNKPSLIDAPDPCTLLNGSTGFVSFPTTGLPTGNSAWTMGIWFMITANPSGAAKLMQWGNWGTNKAAPHLGMNTSGQVFVGTFNGDTTPGAATAASLNVPHLLVGVWDGGTLVCLLDGVRVATATPGTLAITLVQAFIGKDNIGEFFPGYLGHAFVHASAFSDATVANMYAVGVSREAFVAYDQSSTTAASTVLIQYAQRNAASTTTITSYGVAAPATTFTNWQRTATARAVPTLTMASDPVVGSTITGYARQDNLLDLLGALALQGGDIGFKVELSGSNIVFTVYSPADKTLTAVFSLDRHNLLNGYSWEYSAAQGNHLIAGGANTQGGSTSLTDRLFAENEDATSIGQFGYLEDFLDARQAPDGPTLQQQITGALASDKAALNINATITSIPNTLYFKGPAGKGWDLGDKVRVLVDGFTYDQIVREVEITLAANQVATVTAAIGTPLASEIMQEFQVLNQRLLDIKNGTISLQTNF